MVTRMSKGVIMKRGSKGNIVHKDTGKIVTHKAKAGLGVARERSATSGRFVEAVHKPASMRSKMSEYTRAEADWLNTLVHSAAKVAVTKG